LTVARRQAPRLVVSLEIADKEAGVFGRLA
jgi:hypothetical protein